MENYQQQFNGSFAQHGQYNANVNGFPLVPDQNSHGIRGAQHEPGDGNLPMGDGEIPENTVQQPQYGDANNVAPNSPPISAENFHIDSSVDMANIIDQIMGRAAPPALSFSDTPGFQANAPPALSFSDTPGFQANASPALSFSDTPGFQANAYMNAATPPLFVQPAPNNTFMNNVPQSGNFNTLMNNQTQSAPLYNAAQAQSTANGIISSGQPASFGSNYYFPVNDILQQPSMFASNPSPPNWQASAPGNQFAQYSTPPAMFNSDALNSFQPGASPPLMRPQQPSYGNQFANVNPVTPGTSLPMMPQFNSPNINSMMHGNSFPMMPQFNPLYASPMMPETSLPGSAAINPMNTSPMMPGSVAINPINTSPMMPGSAAVYPMNTSPMMPGTYSLPVSSTNARPVASFGNPGRRDAFGPGMSARIEQGYNTFTSSAPRSSPSGSLSSGASTGGNRDINSQILGAPAPNIGGEIMRQDGLGTLASASSSQLGSTSRLETNQQTMGDEPIFNRVYDPRYAELGLPVDPFLRMFNQNPEFWKKVHGNVDLSKK